MQSYEHQVVHESREMRHPYIQDPFSSEVDPNQVSQVTLQQQKQPNQEYGDYGFNLVMMLIRSRRRCLTE